MRLVDLVAAIDEFGSRRDVSRIVVGESDDHRGGVFDAPPDLVRGLGKNFAGQGDDLDGAPAQRGDTAGKAQLVEAGRQAALGPGNPDRQKGLANRRGGLRLGAPARGEGRHAFGLAPGEAELDCAAGDGCTAACRRQGGGERLRGDVPADAFRRLEGPRGVGRKGVRGVRRMAVVGVSSAAGEEQRQRAGALRLDGVADIAGIVGGPQPVVGAEHNGVAGIGEKRGDRAAVGAGDLEHRQARVGRTTGMAAVAGDARIVAHPEFYPRRQAGCVGTVQRFDGSIFERGHMGGIEAGMMPADQRLRAAMGVRRRHHHIVGGEGAARPDRCGGGAVKAKHVEDDNRGVADNQRSRGSRSCVPVAGSVRAAKPNIFRPGGGVMSTEAAPASSGTVIALVP